MTTIEEPRDVRLRIKAIGGMPLSMAGYILRAIGAGYPNTVIDSRKSEPWDSDLTLVIPASDYIESDPDISDWHLAEMAPDKDDPALVAFTSGIRDGSFGVTPPPWITAMLRVAAESIEDSIKDIAPNYLSIELHPEDSGAPFVWIICRRDGKSPHDLRVAAETRVAVLEEQLREAGVKPTRRKTPRKTS